MKRLLLFTLTLAMLTVANVQQVRAYSTDDLTAAGWTQVTDLGSLTVSDYYFVLVDAGTSNYSVANPLPGTNERPAYQVLIDPLADKSQLWKLSYDSANARYIIQSAVDDWYFQGGTGANQGWTDLMSNALNDNCYFTFANSDGKFSITSTISTGTFVGPWNNNGAVNLAGNRNWNNTKDDRYESLACNKNAEHAPGYYIYYISRSTYDAAYTAASAALTANGWTLVNTAEGLGLDGYYYAFVDCSEDGYESNLVMAGSTNSRPNYQVFDANATIQHWNLIAKGEGFQMQNRNTNTYAVCNDGASWNTGFTNDAANQYTEFRFTLADGKWTICNVCATDNFLGRWENSPLRPAIGEGIAANKAAVAGKRLFLIYSIPSIAGVAIALPEGGAMEANQWYYFDVNSEEEYSFNTTTAADIVWTADGTLLESQATALPSGNTDLTTGRYYIKSSSDNNFVLEAPRPTTEQIAELQSLITAGDAKILGFDNGEYAPYNNVAAILALADAKTLNLDNPNQYTQSFIAGKIAAMQNATWTANTSEVNAIYDGTFEAASSVTTNTCPTGWHGSDAHYTEGYWVRLMHGTADSNAGLLHFANGNAMMAKSTPRYGLEPGYTLPLKANTYYKISFDFAGWGGGNADKNTTIVITDANGNAVSVVPAATANVKENGNSNQDAWQTYTGVFQTGDAGDYRLTFNKAEGDGSSWQITYGNIELVRYNNEALPYTLETGAMNADVRTAQQNAAATYDGNPTVENYEALLTAIEAAKASEAIYQTINQRISALDAQKGSVDISELTTKYNDGVYVNADDVITNYRSLVAAALNSPAADDDMTPYIVNPSFEFGDMTAWSYGNGSDQGAKRADNDTYRFSDSDGNYVFNTWNNTGAEVYIFQDLSNLPWGRYEVSAVFASDANISINFRASVDGGASHIDNVFTTGQDNHTGVSKSFELNVTNGRLRIAATAPGFFKVDKFQLKYIGNPAVELPTAQMNADVKAAMLAAKATYDADQSQENYNALLAAIETANQSIALYKQIKARLDLLTSASQRGSISEENAKAMSFYTKYSDGMVNETADATTGTYTSLDEVVPEYKANIAAYWTTNAPKADDDLTAFIVNQGLDFGNAEWSGGGVNHGNIEWYNGNYDVNQTLSGLPTGTYKLQAQGYYRPGDNENASTAQNALLYGGTTTQPVVLIASEGKSEADADNGFTTKNTNSESAVYVPNSQADAAKVFANAEAYNNEVTFVVNGESVNIGFKKDVLIAYDWTCFDNFRLTYVSDQATVAPEPVNAPMNDSIRTAQQNAFDTWNANKTVENYNALLAAIEAAQASADKYVTINTIIPKLEAQKGTVDVAELTTKYNAGEYVEVDDVFTAYHDIVKTALASPAVNADMTPFIINPSFEFGDTSGWGHADPNTTDTGARDANNDTYKFTNSDGNWVFNTWGADFLWVVQQLTDLPQGTYELSAVFAANNDMTIEFTAENVQPDGTINEKKLTFMPKDTDVHYGKETGIQKTVQFMVSDGTLKIGAHANGFFKVDNFQLKFISPNFINDVDLEQPMNMYEKENYEQALAAYNTNPTKELLRDLIEKKVIVENSIKAYAAADSTLKRVKAMMSKTNVYTYDAYFTIDDMYRKYGPEEGFYGFRILEDDVAYDLERMFFGAGHYRNYVQPFGENPDLTWMGDIPAVPFIASAWDCEYDGYAYRYKDELTKEDGTHFTEGSDYYANTWSTEGVDDGTNMLNPYLEYWLYGDQLLAPRTMTATVEGTPGKQYSVKMFVRVRTNQPYYDEANDPNHESPITAAMPKGMSIQIGDGTPVVPNWQFIDNRDSYYKLNNENQLWVCNLWDYTEENLPKGYVDDEGKLRIKFIIGNESNVTWLSMKDVYVNYNGENLDEIKAQVAAEVAYAKEHFVDNLGFDTNDYAPYTNVEELTTYKRASQVNDASWNYFLLKSVYDKLYAFNHGGTNGEGTWTKNTREMNGFYWKNDYTAEDVQHVEWYEYQDDCITPSGWDLIGREDGFSTGIKKLGVNTDDTSMLALPDSTGLLTKYETSYGEQLGYTLPLKKGVKYIMTFKYAYMDKGECPEPTDITLKTGTGWAINNTTDSHLEITQITPQGQGTDKEDLINWKMYRATFTPTIENLDNPGKPVNYLITFDKDNAHDPVPVMLGELTLVRYKEDAELGDAQRHINGTNQTGYSYTPDFVGGNFQVTRPWYTKAYNTLVLPFTLDGSELKTALGENFDGKVYFYTGAINTGGEYYQLQFEARKNGGIFANVPVMIWNPEGSSINALDQKTFNRTVTRYVDNDTNDDNHPTIFDADGYDFVGTYETIKIPVGASYIHSDNTFHKSTGKANLAATRAYFIPLDMKGDLKAGAKLMGFSIDEVPTGIVAIEEDGEMHVTSGNIYSVDGRLVRANATTLEGLPSGTYVVDGKKYFVK